MKNSVKKYKGKVYQYYICHSCQNERMGNYRGTEIGKKNTRLAVKRYQQNNPEKVHSWYKVWYNKVRKNPCVVCKNPISHAHHEDYSKPLKVIWLCPFHHKQQHAKV
jgi:hypothetical protein